MEKKLIISDLDGTLLNNKSELSKETIMVIKEINKQGHLFCISTGRPIRSAIKFYKQLGLNTIMSTLNGSIITNPSSNKFMPINLCFNKSILERIISNNQIIKNINYLIVENFDSTYIIEINKKVDINQWMYDHFHITKDNVTVISKNELSKIKGDLNSMIICANKKYADIISFEIKSALFTLVVRMWDQKNSDDIIIEVNSRYADKGSFLKYASSYYGIPINETYVFGDGDNDMNMIKSTPKAYAMKNASPLVKLLSYNVTPMTNDEDGVVNVLKRELKIKNK